MGRIYDLFVSKYNYTDFHELNLDWLIAAIKEIEYEVENFVTINAVKYADPIQWDITRSYEKNTIVIDGHSGVAYISVAPVPSGVALTHPEYWTVIFDLSMFITKGAANFANHYESQPTTTATMNTNKGEWLVWDSTLFEALNDIHPGDSYVVDGNIKKMTVEEFYNGLVVLIASVESKIGDLSNLPTTDKSNLVAAITELANFISSEIGDLSQLDTSVKTNLVSAINSLLSDLTSEIGNLSNKMGNLSDLPTTDKSSLVAAITELANFISGEIGDLSQLSSVDKQNLVAAINWEIDRRQANDAILRNYIDQQISGVADKHIVMITDSYGNRLNSSSKNVGDILSEAGIDIKYYHAISGCGFIKTGSDNPMYYLYDYTGDHNDITDVYFCMSANDNDGTIDSVASAVYTAVMAAKTAYPNARIVIVPWGAAFVNTAWALFLQDNTLRGYNNGAASSGAIVVDNAQYILRHTGLLDVDLIHPNNLGVDSLASNVLGYIRGNSIDINYRVQCGLTVASADLSEVTTYPLTMYRHNGDVTFTTDTARGIIGEFNHPSNTDSFNFNPAFTTDVSLYSRSQTATDKYMNIRGRCRLADHSGYIGGNLMFTIYNGHNVRVFIKPDSYALVDRFASCQNFVMIND